MVLMVGDYDIETIEGKAGFLTDPKAMLEFVMQNVRDVSTVRNGIHWGEYDPNHVGRADYRAMSGQFFDFVTRVQDRAGVKYYRNSGGGEFHTELAIDAFKILYS